MPSVSGQTLTALAKTTIDRRRKAAGRTWFSSSSRGYSPLAFRHLENIRAAYCRSLLVPPSSLKEKRQRPATKGARVGPSVFKRYIPGGDRGWNAAALAEEEAEQRSPAARAAPPVWTLVATEDLVLVTRCYSSAIWRCWNGRSERLTRPRRWSAGPCPKSSPPCAGCSRALLPR